MAEVDKNLVENNFDQVPKSMPMLDNTRDLSESQEPVDAQQVINQVSENFLESEEITDQGNSQSLDNVVELENAYEEERLLEQQNAHILDDTLAEQKDGKESYSVGGVEKKWPGWPGESVYRMLVPAHKVGSIIGRKGEFIKKIIEETKARVKILDGPMYSAERAVMVFAKEEPDSPLPPAIDGLLRVHKRIIHGTETDSSHGSGMGGKISTKLLLPSSQAGSLIGKQGGTVKSVQESSNCMIKVLGTEDLPSFALQDDRVVEVVGDIDGVHKAVELIASHLRKFLVDRSVIPMFEKHMQMGNRPMEHMPPQQPWGRPEGEHMPPHQPWGRPEGEHMLPHLPWGLPAGEHMPPQQVWGRPEGIPSNPGGGPSFRPNPQFMPPPHQLENYYPPTDFPPPMDRPSHLGISAYGREASMSVHTPADVQSTPSVVTQVTQEMQIPLSYADTIIGIAGANISYIRRTSGATVTIQESRGGHGEMTVEINGTASQVQTAQQLIQNFMAGAASGQPQQQSGTTTTTEQGYNSYTTNGSAYTTATAPAPAPSSNADDTNTYGGAPAAYASAYGTNYGY